MTVQLSPQQLAVLKHVARGCTNREIAEQFAITEGTVKDHLAQILQRLGATNRANAVLLAMRAGVLS